MAHPKKQPYENIKNEFTDYESNPVAVAGDSSPFAVLTVTPGSIAAELGIEPGDSLVCINDKPIRDVFDYRYLIRDEYIEVLLRKAGGEEWLLEVEKDEDEDLGLEFASGLLDKARRCGNNCIFCFIDQLPGGLRPSLYFKDDDSRLSFLQGNYVTLTNMSDEDIDRIVFYHLSPIQISVHAADPVFRRFMLKNPRSDKLFTYMDRLAAAHIDMNFQIVLVKGVNDGAQLDRSIGALADYWPRGKSLSVVPMGLTKYREGLFDARPFTREEALAVLAQVERWQESCLARFGARFVYAADEFYLTAGRPAPPAEAYEDFPQIENGVGMLAAFRQAYADCVAEEPEAVRPASVSIATGTAAYPTVAALARDAMERYPQVEIRVYAIRNDFWGESITVSGLVTGGDLLAQLKGKTMGEALLLPDNMVRGPEDPVFLDDMTVAELSDGLGVPVETVPHMDAGWILRIIKQERDW